MDCIVIGSENFGNFLELFNEGKVNGIIKLYNGKEVFPSEFTYDSNYSRKEYSHRYKSFYYNDSGHEECSSMYRYPFDVDEIIIGDKFISIDYDQEKLILSDHELKILKDPDSRSTWEYIRRKKVHHLMTHGGNAIMIHGLLFKKRIKLSPEDAIGFSNLPGYYQRGDPKDTSFGSMWFEGNTVYFKTCKTLFDNPFDTWSI